MNCIVCPDEGCLPDGASPLTGDGCLVVPIRGKMALKITMESTSFENASYAWCLFLLVKSIPLLVLLKLVQFLGFYILAKEVAAEMNMDGIGIFQRSRMPNHLPTF
ncbi:hypothetical protein L2E82_31329 [Cichorium intybus]|uniref:Uncharacterized protein n=1 Tax=Cichorium intybus TaxID=13427 RepID=A0ACB9D333_CICIN|nr:hypothetical protein L2E82_31329 [Cichorium intybus]